MIGAVLGALSVLIGVLGFVGVLISCDVYISAISHDVRMYTSTSASFVLCGVVLLSASRGHTERVKLLVQTSLSIMCGFLTLFLLLRYVTRIDVSSSPIYWFFSWPSLGTIIGFLMFSAAELCRVVAIHQKRICRGSFVLGIAILLLGACGLLGHMIGNSLLIWDFPGDPEMSLGMAASTCLGFVILGAGVYVQRQEV